MPSLDWPRFTDVMMMQENEILVVGTSSVQNNDSVIIKDQVNSFQKKQPLAVLYFLFLLCITFIQVVFVNN
jgi:hypothetical protein